MVRRGPKGEGCYEGRKFGRTNRAAIKLLRKMNKRRLNRLERRDAKLDMRWP